MELIRQPAVAGQFYPDDPDQLRQMITNGLKVTSSNANNPSDFPKAIIVPHAGYSYSGNVAANGFAFLQQYGKQIKKVVLLGPAHTRHFHGLASCSYEFYRMPLGDVPIDQTLLSMALQLPQVICDDEAHVQEHSLEIQLPFLQILLADFTFLPLVVGHTNPDKVAEVLTLLWGNSDTLIVISSDLSHYHDYDTARKKDHKTSEAILHLHYQELDFDSACGRNPIKGLLYLAHRIGLEAHLIDQCNSGDTAGSKDRVVGYASYHFYPLKHYAKTYGDDLIKLAKQAIVFTLKTNQVPEVKLSSVPAVLHKKKATFVTLKLNGQLRGCIGSLTPTKALASDIVHNAYQAAFHDPRFPRLTESEFQTINIAISILSDNEPIDFDSEESLIKALRPGIDGVILVHQDRRGTFLPSVWDELPDPERFLQHLKQKAGLTLDFWSDDIQAYRYTTECIQLGT